MKFIPCTPETKDRMIALIKSYTHVYGVDIVECGSQELHIQFINHYSDNHPRVVMGEYVDDDGQVISMNAFYFAETLPVCLIRSGFHTKIGLERYTVPQIIKETITLMWGEIQRRGVTEIYFVQRAARARQVRDMFLNDDDIKTMFEGWAIRDYEYLEPFTSTTHELLGVYLLGPMNGIIPKPMVIKQLYKKSVYIKNDES